MFFVRIDLKKIQKPKNEGNNSFSGQLDQILVQWFNCSTFLKNKTSIDLIVDTIGYLKRYLWRKISNIPQLSTTYYSFNFGHFPNLFRNCNFETFSYQYDFRKKIAQLQKGNGKFLRNFSLKINFVFQTFLLNTQFKLGSKPKHYLRLCSTPCKKSTVSRTEKLRKAPKNSNVSLFNSCEI